MNALRVSGNPKGSRKKKGKICRSYSKSFKLRLVKMRLEDKIPLNVICKETGVPCTTISTWLRRYKTEGEDAFIPKRRPSAHNMYPAVVEKVVSVKKENPSFGIRRISDILRRWFLLPASPSTVRTVLKEENLLNPAPKKRKCNVRKPRRFERSTPNQMWQSDIMMFRMGGRQLYLIGYIDDYSRYIVGLELYASQTADNVIELYRRATTEFSLPKEMLTDNGRQYTNWRGKTKFEKTLEKDRVKHIRSQPHHPMTLGKIERFWQTIFEELLRKSQFESFDDARERLVLWVQYYNHKRPHQGINGLCPADRYFEVASEVRRTIEAGVKENALELALRGKPRDPFYLVGRMDGQSVVLRAQKGKLKLTVDDKLKQSDKEHEFDIDKERNDDRGDKNTDGPTAENTEAQEQEGIFFNGRAESRSGPESMGGAQYPLAGVPGDEYLLEHSQPLAEQSDGGDASGIRALYSNGQGDGSQSSSSEPAEEAEYDVSGKTDEAVESIREKSNNGELEHGSEQNTTAHGADTAGVVRSDHSLAGSKGAWSIAQDLPPVAEQSACGNGGVVERPSNGQTINPGGSGEAETSGAGGGSYGSVGVCSDDTGGQENAGGIPSAAEIALRRFRDAS